MSERGDSDIPRLSLNLRGRSHTNQGSGYGVLRGVRAGIIILSVEFRLHHAGSGIGAWREHQAGKAVDKTPGWHPFQGCL